MNDLTLVESAGALTPTDYQLAAARRVADALAQGLRRILVVLPTGSGKTLTAKLITLSHEVRDALGTGEGRALRVLFISHRHRLNRQAEATFGALESVELTLHSAFSPLPQAVIERGWDICLVDEGHHEAMLSFQHQLENLASRPIIGLTADDQRGDGYLLKFETVVRTLTEEEAVERGVIEAAGINTVVDNSGKDKAPLACKLVDQYHHHMGNTIAFFRTNAECHAFAEHLAGLGIKTLVVDNHMGEDELDAALGALSRGEVQFLVNCQRIGEGVDCNAVTDVLLARQFSSRAEKRQYIGRAARRDSPCQVWEFQNPALDRVAAVDCVGGTRFERLLFHRRGEWHERLLSGEDPHWGQMSERRFLYAPAPKAEEQAAPLATSAEDTRVIRRTEQGPARRSPEPRRRSAQERPRAPLHSRQRPACSNPEQMALVQARPGDYEGHEASIGCSALTPKDGHAITP